MVELIKISFEELRDFVMVAYTQDDDLLNLYHVDKYNLEQAVDKTMEMIEITSKEVDMDYFGAVLNDDIIGYLCSFQNNLYSFGINKVYRNKLVLIEFWERIKEVLGNNFMTVLYPNNTRAINWAKKCGMKEQKCVVLLYNN